MCDTIDIFCRSMKSDSDEWKRTEEFVIKSKDKLFDSFCVEVFFNAFSDEIMKPWIRCCGRKYPE